MYEFAKECGDYQTFVDSMREVGYTETPDKVAYNDSGLDVERLDEFIRDLSDEEESTEAEDEAEDEAERFAHTEECEEGHDYY